MEADTAAAISAVRSIKFAFSGEIRRVGVGSLERDVSGLVTVGSLRKAVRAAFPALKSRNFCLTYRDEDGDVVTVTKSKHELDESFRVAAALSLAVLRFDVAAMEERGASDDEKDAKEVVPAATHPRVICDGCGANPITGVRYKCSVRDDFDLCGACEAASGSPWPFLAIKDPSQAPASIMVVLRPGQPVPGPSAPRAAAGDAASTAAFIDAVRALESATGSTVEPAAPTPAPTPAAAPAASAAPAKTVESLVYKLDGEALSAVRLECVASVKEFGPFVALRKINGTLVLRAPHAPVAGANGLPHAKPWKLGGCLRLGKDGVDLAGSGGPWASFHVEKLEAAKAKAAGGGGDSVFDAEGPRPVRLVCENRRLALGAVAGHLVGVPAAQRGPHTIFKLHPASVACDEVDPAWDEFDKQEPERRATGAAAAEEAVVVAAAAEGSAASVSEDETLARLLSAQWNGDELSGSLLAATSAAMPQPMPAPVVKPPPPDAASALPPASAFVAAMDKRALTPTAGAWAPPPTPAACFVADVTFPDGAAVAAGASFRKVWRLRNDGDAPFPASVRLVRVSGGTLLDTGAAAEPVPVALPLQEFDAAVSALAPLEPGRHVGYWRLEDAATGSLFGHRLWADVLVLPQPEPEPAAEPAAELVAEVEEAAVVREYERLMAEQAEAGGAAPSAAHEATEAIKQPEPQAPLAPVAEPDLADLAPPVPSPLSASSDNSWEMAEPEPAPEPATEPANAEPATKPATEPATKPATKPATELAPEPAPEPTAEAEAVPEALTAVALAPGVAPAPGVALSVDLGATVEGLLEDDALSPSTVGRCGDAASEDAYDDCDEDENVLRLSASLEGAALAGSELNAAGLLDDADGLSASVSAALAAHVETQRVEAQRSAAAEAAAEAEAAERVVAEASAIKAIEAAGPWGGAVGVLVEMGFTDVGVMVAACEKHCGKTNYGAFERKIQEVVSELLTGA